MEPVVSLSPLKQSGLSPENEKRVEQVVAPFLKEYDVQGEVKKYASHILDSMPGPGATLVLVDDLSAIDHVHRVKNVGTYCSRAFTRARDGDIVLASLDPIPGYHEYMDKRLNLGNSYYIYVAPNDPERNYHLFESLKHDQSSLGKILSYTSLNGELVIHPYMGSYGAWDIARLLSEPRENPVKVMGPLPIASKIANDKNDFLSIVQQLCGKEHTVDCSSASTRKELEALIEKKAKSYEKLVMRYPGSAGGMSTEVFESDFVLNQKDDFQRFLDAYISEYGWEEGKEKLQVSGWEPEVLMAPSSHLWIPPGNEEPPIFEEILMQTFDDVDPTVFAGSRVANLPDRISKEIEELTMIVGRALQKIGYVGRCSFDLLLCGPSLEKCKIKFVECNGRWGGASTPMTLMNRIFGDHRKHAYFHRVLQAPPLIGVSFIRFLELFDDILYDHRSGQGYAIVYNVALLESKGQLDMITIGDSVESARERMEEFKNLASERLV